MGSRGELTRRQVLGGAALGGAGALLAPTAARARARSSPIISRWVGELSDRPTTLDMGDEFVLAGVQWSTPADARIELRTPVAGGRMGPWAVVSGRGHDPDHATGAQLTGEPAWTGSATRLQLRSIGRVRGVTVHAVRAPAAAPGVSALARAAAQLVTPSLPAGPGQPPILARSSWAPPSARPAAGPFYGAVSLAFVHHTDNPNGYGPDEVPALILAIYQFHRYVRGWFDIGYNFVIDLFGRIWEAREGGVDEPVEGAQAGGYNAVSTGVAVLGTFASVLPSPPALRALQRLLAWKLSLHGIPTRGHVQVRVDPAGASFTPFAPGQLVSLPRIAGHRDGCTTDCPGDALYQRLPEVRAAAHGLAGVPAQLTLQSASLRLVAGAAVTVGGRLARLGGPPLAGATVQVQSVPDRRALATLITDADRRFSSLLTPTRSTLLRALHADAPAAVSDVLELDLVPVITLTLTSISPPRVSGTVRPFKRRVTIDLYRLTATGRRLVSSTRVDVVQGAFSARVRPLRLPPGRYEAVARLPADDVTVAGASAPVRV